MLDNEGLIQGVWREIFEAVVGSSAVPHQVALDSSRVKIHRRGGAEAQAIGNTKGGRNTKVHAVVDELCRPWVLVLKRGDTNDSVMAQPCVSLDPRHFGASSGQELRQQRVP